MADFTSGRFEVRKIWLDTGNLGKYWRAKERDPRLVFPAPPLATKPPTSVLDLEPHPPLLLALLTSPISCSSAPADPLCSLVQCYHPLHPCARRPRISLVSEDEHQPPISSSPGDLPNEVTKAQECQDIGRCDSIIFYRNARR